MHTIIMYSVFTLKWKPIQPFQITVNPYPIQIEKYHYHIDPINYPACNHFIKKSSIELDLSQFGLIEFGFPTLH